MRSIANILLLGISLTVRATPIRLDEVANITGRDLWRDNLITPGATDLEWRWQPVLDFDQDGCYYTSGFDKFANHNPGLGAANGAPPECLRRDCRNPDRLENSRVFSRWRCNNGVCAIMYEYYFEKDQTLCGSYISGHRHDWENIVVFVRDNRVIRVAPSSHDNYNGATNSPRLEGERPKVVYHKDGTSTHCFRMAKAADDAVENYTGRWYLGQLVGWWNYPSVDVRNRALDWGSGPAPKLAEAKFADYLNRAAGGQVPGFNPNINDN
ncbi:necrosis inducing protein-domain-containing protein [Podospora didyma]|uniref:Necrosis inducing protein-domain-containing protein n=1 Tax=Podospora didyma TaxID=330526 RepID=A0AAE0TZH2_9PEZI|nr:necrosis inducing protein-domain-containing protein [Podospora didyma]